MLLTGVDHHRAGIGNLPRRITPEQAELPGYEGFLNERVVTVASLLREAGYHTYMAGKWEIGETPGSLPAARGFERSFVLHDSAASYFEDGRSTLPGREHARFTENGRPVKQLPEGYYSTRYFTEFLLESIESGLDDGRPFFAYLAFQAPHGPLGLPDAWLDRSAGRYDGGYGAVREARILRMKRRGLVHESVRPFPGIPTVPGWDELDDEQRRLQKRKMELYAALVENMDYHVGRLLAFLREQGLYEDTLVVFLSDNGAEPGDRGPSGMDPRNREWLARQFPDSGFENWGRKGSFVEYGAGWAQVSTAPFRMFKGTQAEGGVRAPLIVSGPAVAKGRGAWRRDGRVTHAMLHVSDLAPTFLELAGVPHPSHWRGRRVEPMTGRSLSALLADEWRARHGPHEWLAFELSGDRAIRRGGWKAVWMAPPFGSGDWQLYRIEVDPAELFDLSQAKAERTQELVALWNEYAAKNGVVVPGGSASPLPDDSEVEAQR
jgi:arylsulfatase